MPIAELLLAIATFCGVNGHHYEKECSVRVLTCYKETVEILSSDESVLMCLTNEVKR